MHVYGVDIRKFDENQVREIISDFLAAGWELDGKFNIGKNDFHQFVTFRWLNDSPPIMPEGFSVPGNSF